MTLEVSPTPASIVLFQQFPSNRFLPLKTARNIRSNRFIRLIAVPAVTVFLALDAA